MAWHIFIYHRLYIHMYEGFIMIISYDDARERERINQKTRESHVRTAFCGDITQIYRSFVHIHTRYHVRNITCILHTHKSLYTCILHTNKAATETTYFFTYYVERETLVYEHIIHTCIL